MLKNKNKLFVVTLLNVSLVIGPVQMTLASVTSVTEKNSHSHTLKNKKAKPCKHAGSSVHPSKMKNNVASMSSMNMHKAATPSMHKTMTENDKEQHACQCSSLCADCCGGHATVAILDFEFYNFIKPSSSQPDNKPAYFKNISLPVENPPPVA